MLESARRKIPERLVEWKEEFLETGIHRYVVLAALVLLPAVYFTEHWVAFLLAVLTAVVSFGAARTEINSLGVETATFATVLMGVVFGPEKGAILGFIYIFLQLFTGKMPGMYIIWVIPAFTAAGHLAGRFSEVGIVRLGFSISLGLQLFFVLMTVLLMRSSVAKYTRYAIFNVVFNYVIFSAFGPTMIRFLGA